MRVQFSIFALAVIAATSTAAAGVTIDAPSLSAARPASGSIIHSITGKVDRTGYNYLDIVISDEANFWLTGDPSSPMLTVTYNAAYKAFKNNRGAGDVYTGALLDLTLTSTSVVGHYADNAFSGGTPYYLVDSLFVDEFGDRYPDTVRKFYSFDVTPEAVPEPATMVALGLGGLAIVRRRKRA